MDEMEQFGYITSVESKKYSNKMYSVSKVVPANEIDAAISRLEAEFQQKQAERDMKIKKIKIKKKAEKKVVEKLTPTQRFGKFDSQERLLLIQLLELCNP